MAKLSLVSFRKSLGGQQKALENFLGNEQNAMRFMSSVVHCIQQNPKLLECTESSLLNAFMQAAANNLYPSNFSGDAYVVPYKGEAQFQIGYQGLKTLAYRAGIIRCGAEVVYENDTFRQELGTVQTLHHVPATGDRGKAIGVYCWAEIKSGVNLFKYMDSESILAFKKFSPGSSSSYSPWNQKNDPELWMWKKTVFKQFAKMLPTSDTLANAIQIDNDNSIIEAEVVQESAVMAQVKQDTEADFEKLVEQISAVTTTEEFEACKTEVADKFRLFDTEKKQYLKALLKEVMAQVNSPKPAPAAPVQEVTVEPEIVEPEPKEEPEEVKPEPKKTTKKAVEVEPPAPEEDTVDIDDILSDDGEIKDVDVEAKEETYTEKAARDLKKRQEKRKAEEAQTTIE